MLWQPVSTPDKTSRLRFIARQPLFDLGNRIHGYELLYRHGTEINFQGDIDYANRVTLDNTLVFGLNALTGRTMAFVNCTRNTLLRNLVTLLPPQSTVLEILESVEPDAEVLRACTELREMGYKIALDDFVFRPGVEKFLPLTDYIKVDFAASTPEQRRSIRERITDPRIRFVAEKVETLQDFEAAVREGYEYFQGYYFCRPVLMTSSEIPPNRRNYLAILFALHQDPLNLNEVEKLVKGEPSLCYRLLRLVNSALSGLRQEVTSVMSALLTIGDQQFRKLASISIAAELNEDQTVELLVLALARARFCETCAEMNQEAPSEQYLLGLFSLFPAILRVKMEDMLPSLPFRPEIIEALLGKDNHARRLLSCLEEYEQGNWEECSQYCSTMGIAEPQIVEHYTQAVIWAEKALAIT
jgi:c-di-GMP-related signal transduction protein